MPSSNTLPLSRTSTASRHSSTPLWDPRTTLQIALDNRCVGHAYSKGRKCSVRLAAHNVYKGNTVLQDLSTHEPEPDAIRDDLRRLAEVLLCPRWHHDQAQDMVDKWVGQIEDAYPSPTVEVETQRATSSSTWASLPGENPRQVTPSRSGTLSTRTVSTLSTPEFETLLGKITAMQDKMDERAAAMQQTMNATQEMLRTAHRRLAELENTGPSTSTSPMTTGTVSRVSTSDISSLALSRTSTINNIASTLARESADDASPSSPRTCTRAHVRRRAIDDECPICHDDFLLRDRLVWCRNSCGRSVHRACFETWEVQCRAGGRTATCGVCRADWESCGCDD